MTVPLLLLILVFVLILVLAALATLARGRTTSAGTLWHTNIEADTKSNTNWRDVVYTSDGLQVSLMSVPPGESLGAEVHPHSDQFFRFESGSGELIAGDRVISVSDGSAVVVPMGMRHDVKNTSDSEPLSFYTIYAPPHHPRGTVDRTHVDEIAREKIESHTDNILRT